LGSTTERWKDLYLSGNTLVLGNVVMKNTPGGNSIAFYGPDGSTPATIDANVEIVSDSIAAGTSTVAFASGGGNIELTAGGTTTGTITATGANVTGYITASGNITGSYFFGDGSQLTGIDSTAINNGTSNVSVASSGGDITMNRGGTLTATVGTAGITMNNGTFVGDLTGTADDADAMSSAVTVALTGDVTGSATFTSAGDTASIATTIAANSVALGTDTTGNYVAAGATSGSGISGSVSSEGGTFTVTSNATSSNTANTIVFRDASGNFSAGVVTATATAARYADLAENYEADSAIEPGTVVMFAGAGKVAACDTENCRAVAGIISTDPAHLMNSTCEGVPLALAGRVPTKVTGPVNAGDLMVSAGNGRAMANNDAATGTIIGKAIESHDGGEGVIEVLALMM
jgi:hypothetical protein